MPDASAHSDCPKNQILLTSADDTVSDEWAGIQLNGGEAWLSATTVRYAQTGIAVDNGGLTLSGSVVTADRGHGLHFIGATILSQGIHESQIFDNGDKGIQNDTGIEIDARHNWWGHPFGPYHPSLNPEGLGEEVSDDVLFDPWWRTADGSIAERPFVDVAGPGWASPGGQARYVVSYANDTEQALQNAVLVVVLPGTADYVESNGGLYWPERHQLYWSLGDVHPGSTGTMDFEVRYLGGLPVDSRDGVLAFLIHEAMSGSIYGPEPYLQSRYPTVAGERPITAGEREALLQSSPDLRGLVAPLIAGGYRLLAGNELSLSSGEKVVSLVAANADERSIARITVADTRAPQAMVYSRTGLSAFEADGGLHWSTDDGSILLQNHWSIDGGTYGQCIVGCAIEQMTGWTLSSVDVRATTMFDSYACTRCAVEGDEVLCSRCAAALDTPASRAASLTMSACGSACGLGNVQSSETALFECEDDLITCVGGGTNLESSFTFRCDPETGKLDLIPKWDPCPLPVGGITPPGTPVLQTGCIEGYGCVEVDEEDEEECILPGVDLAVKNYGNLLLSTSTLLAEDHAQSSARTLDSSGGPSCGSDGTEIDPPHDPNAKYGPVGDLLPGQMVTYEIEIENEGQGTAYGVFVADKLSEKFDPSSLQIHGDGEFGSTSGTIYWWIGELAPKGQVGSTDVVSFTVDLRPDLPSGTIITNQAVVHFPTVPEETPTNAVINVVQPLIAVPQSISTEAGKPVSIQLQGRDVANSPLTYLIAEDPIFGDLTGSAPTFTYTPMEGFVGTDHLRFQVNNGVSTSPPAEVRIVVEPAADDAAGPRVVRTWPAPDEWIGEVRSTSYMTFGENSLYAPALQIDFSEPIDAASLDSTTITLKDANERTLAAGVGYDGTLRRATIWLYEPLQAPMGYTVTVNATVSDLRGNPMDGTYAWRFQTGNADRSIYLPLIQK